MMANRPIAPHLQIWKWGPHMAISILHRVTGDGLALAGLAVLLWWLGAMAAGPDAYATFQTVMGSPLGMGTAQLNVSAPVVALATCRPPGESGGLLGVVAYVERAAEEPTALRACTESR